MKVGMEIAQYMPLIQVNIVLQLDLIRHTTSIIYLSGIALSSLYFRIPFYTAKERKN